MAEASFLSALCRWLDRKGSGRALVPGFGPHITAQWDGRELALVAVWSEYSRQDVIRRFFAPVTAGPGERRAKIRQVMEQLRAYRRENAFLVLCNPEYYADGTLRTAETRILYESELPPADQILDIAGL